MAEDPGNVVKIEFNTVELPPSVEIRESSVISGQAGAFSKTLIAKDTKFGPYKGEIINAGQKDYIDYRYAWEVFEKDSNDLRLTISALDPKSSNWMRHVNCARFYEEQNILSIQEEYSIYYVAMKNIKPGEELLTWFDPKLLKRTKRRLSKMGRKPVGYTIELVPWSDEKKFVPEIIDTKRKRKKKVLSDMISLDENPLVITRTLQSLSKIPCTPKQLAQSSFKGTSMNVGFKHSRAVSPASESLLSKAKKGSKPPSQTINVPPKTENKMNEYVTSKSSSETCKQQQEGTDKSKCASFDHASTAESSQKEARKVLSLGDVKATDKKVNKHVLLKKTPIKLGRARLQFSTHRGLLHVDTSVVKPVVVKQHEDGSTSVEDHDETYILNNIQLRPECDEKCPCLASNQRVKSSSSVTTKQDSFVIHFTLLPEHKSLSRDNKIIYRCDVCDGAYNHAFSLKRHYLSVHVNHRYLSRDDILSCQIETFHMDIDHQTEGSQKETDTLLKDQESTALKMQSAPPTTTEVSSCSQAEISDNPGQSVAEECENNGKEDINSEAKEAVDVQQFTNVPSLKHLVQISLCKTKRVTETPCSPVSVGNLSMTCDEVTNDSCVTDICVSSEGEESVQIDLPRQLDPGLDCVISEQNKEMSVAVFASQGSPCVHTDIEKPHGDTLEAMTGQEAADCEAHHVTARNSCSNTSENILDLNPDRLEQHDNNDERNLLLNGEVSLNITDLSDFISKSKCEIHCGISELCGDLLVKTTTDYLHECANGEVDEKGVVEESGDLCHSHVKNQALTNHDEASADFPATLEEDTRTTAVHTLSGYSTETENSDMKSAETENSDMKSAETENPDMKSAETEKSDMKSAQTENPDMKSAQTDNSDMKSAQTENPDMKSEETENSDMKSVQTENSDMKSAETENPDMKSVQTENSDMKSAETEISDMNSAPTENSDMKSAETENPDMKSAETGNPDMKSAETENSDMKSAQTENPDMKSAQTENPDMKSAETENSDMKSAQTENPDMKPAQTENSDMKSAETENSDMKSAQTENPDMKSAETENSDMKSAQTENPDMKSAQTENSDMKSAETENSDMKSAETENSDMKSVQTENSDMKSVQTENSDMKSAQTENPDMKLAQTENPDMKSAQTENSDMKSAEAENSDIKSAQTENSDMKSAETENSDMKSAQTESSDIKSAQTENSDMKSAQTENPDMKSVKTAGSVLDLSRMECGSVQASDADSPGYMIPHCGTSLEVADSSQCLDHPSATASSPSTVLSEEFPAGMNAVSPVVDTTIGSCGLVSPVVNNIAFSSGKAELSEPLQNMDVLTSSIQTQGKQEPLDDHLADNFTVQTTVESSTATTMTTSTSVTKNPSAQKLIFVTNLVFPVVSPSHSQPQNPLSSAPQGSSPLANKTSQSTSVPLVVISQVPCGLTMQNATSAFLPSSNALKALQTMKNSFSVLNFGNSPPGLSLSVLPSGSKSSISPSACDKILLESSLALGMPATTAATTTPSSCAPSLSAPSTEKQLKPSLNLCAPFARISSLVLGGAHLPAPSPGSTQCTASPTVVPLSSISSLISVNNNVTPVDGQPDDLYRCHMCVRVFKTLNELKLHIRNDPHRFKGGIKQYACQQCSMRFSNKNNLMRHNLMNHPESENYKFRCYTCGKGFMCETYLKMHARFHSGRNFPCKYGCKDVYFPNAAALVKHLRTQHPGLNLKEYLRNAKAGQAHGRKLSCLLRTTVEHKPSPGAEGRTLETSPGAVISTLPYSLQQPGVGFQAKRRHSKSSRTTFPDGENTGMADQECESTPDTEESPSNSEDSGRLRYACNVCLKRFRSHLHLLQHRTQQHGAGESVQEYLYQMSKDTLDEEPDTEPITLKFSPPPSPTTFFENVNKRGFENMTHYIDGNKESLKFWQKHLNFQGNSDPMLVSEAVKKLEWTLFNFPPCFEYKEDCTTFYDSANRPGTSPKLLASPAEGHKEKGTWRVQPGLDVHSGTEGAAANALQQEPVKSCIEGAAKSILHFGDETCSQNVSDSLDAYEQGLVGSSKSHDQVSTSPSGIELHQSRDNLANTDSCQSINDAEQISLEQSHERSHMNHVAKNQEVNEGDTLSEMSSVEDVVPEEKVLGTVDTSIKNKEVEAENHYICRHIVHELVNRVVLMQERTLDEQYNSYRPHSVLDGNSNLKACICEGEQSKSAVDESDSLPHVDVKLEIKKEIIIEDVQEMDLTSSEPLTVADTILQRFTECSVQDKLDLFKSQSVQGLNLALSEHNHRLFLQTGCTPRHKSLSHLKSQSLIGALDLHLVNGWMSSEMFDQVVAGGLKQNLSVVTKKALSLESLSLWPPNKLSDRHFDHALDTSLTNSDTSRHDHRRYSIWAGQVHQNFDNTSKREMFCQPVTEAVRKQEVMRERAQYNFEKSIRDNEMQGKHEKITQKMCFAEGLGLMSRKEFELSYHARRQQQCVIKAPEVWNNYENIWFGKKGNIAVVCSICHRHFSCWDLCLRHQLKKHPHIEPASLEMEKDNYVEDMYYYYPMPYGILAQTHLIPDNLPVPEVYVCVRCGFPFKNLNRLHAHMIICDPVEEQTSSSQNGGVQKVSYMKKKLLPMMDRRLHQQVEQPKAKMSKSKSGLDVSAAFAESKHSRSLPVNGKTNKPTQQTSDSKPMASAVQSHSSYPTPFSFYSSTKGKNFELLYNPQNHARRREMYKILDQHQCHGCNLKFNSLYMLEKHVNKCSGKDKLQNQKPLLSGIMPDDAAMRKQHTCRYCGKRFTYIKGVDLHYKRICAVRKVKEEENQLTEEDLAHEEELKKIIEHIKWSKSLSKDSSDIIQGHVRVEEDGTLTPVVKHSQDSQGLKKKVKKKGSKWTTLKRHRLEDDLICASPVSGSAQSSPVMATENKKSVVDEKVADKTNTLDMAGKKRLTRSAGHEGLHRNSGISNMRHTSTDRDTIGKKSKTVSKPAVINSCSKNNSPDLPLTQSKIDGNCPSMKGKPKKMTCDGVIGIAESRHNKTSKNSVKNSRSPPSTRNKIASSMVPPSAAGVAPCIKPPARKRGKPKRFDPSDMESSYKKKKKDEDIVLDQTKSDSGGRKRNTASETRQRAHLTAKASDVCRSSHVLRQTSSRSSTHSSASTPTSQQYVNKNVVTNKEDQSKLLEKMKKLKEAAKSESRKSDQKRKLSVSLFTNSANKKSDSGDKNEKKGDKPMNKVSSSSELFKHLTTSEQLLPGNSPQKAVSNRKRTASVDSAGDVNNSQALGKRLKITTQNRSPAKPALSTTGSATESPGSKANTTAHKYRNKCGDKYKESDQEAPVVRTSSSTNVSQDSKGTLLKPTSPVSKQPTVTFKVVTLSPNGSNLLTYDSSADVPQSSLLLTKPGKVASQTSPSQQVLKCLPQRPIQFVTKSSSLLSGTELQKTNHEQDIKVISAENTGLSILRDVHKQAVSTLVLTEGDNIRIKKPISQVCNQVPISQKDVLCKASYSPDGKQGLGYHAVCRQETNEISPTLRDTEKQTSQTVGPNSQDKVIIKRVIDNYSRESQLIGDMCDGQIIISSPESSRTNSEIVPKLSPRHGVQKCSESDGAQLCYADQLFQKQTSAVGAIDENLSAGHGHVVVNNVSSLLSLTESQSPCQKRQTLSEQTQSEVCAIVQSLSQSHSKSSVCVKSSSLSALRVANSLPPANSHESLSTIIVPSTSVKVHVTVPHAVPTTSATRFTFPSRFRSPAKVVTVTGTVLPHLSQGSSGHSATRILKLGGVNIRNASSAQPQIPSITTQYKQTPNTTRVVPQIVSHKPLVLSAGQLPRLLTTGVHQQHPNTQQIIAPGALRQSMLNISANQTNCATQLLPGRCLSKTVSPQICIPQSSLVNNIVHVAQAPSAASIGTSVAVSSIKSRKTSNVSLVANVPPPVSNQIMFSLDDGTTAMLDPDSLAQFLTVSPSLNKSELYSTASTPIALQEYKSPVVLNIAANQTNHQSVEEINWPANGSVDLTDVSDTLID